MGLDPQPLFGADTPFTPPPLIGGIAEESLQESLPSDVQIQLSAGVELIVRGLERSSPTSAVLHLQCILRQINNNHDPADFQVFPPIWDSTTGVASKPLDYAIIGFRGELRKKPRPELMDALRVRVLEGTQRKVEVDWNLAPGFDKARMIYFRDEEKIGIGKLKDGLEKIMKERSIEYQACTSSGDMVRFHLLHKKDVSALELRLPVIAGRQCIPRTPKYIQPNYALEIGIVGVEMFDDPEYYIGSYIEKTYHHLARYGHAVCQQRLEMNCTVYCVVVENREIAERLLEDPLSMFENCNPKPSRPQYLFHLNQHGYPTSWQRSSSSMNPSEQRVEKRRWENFEERTNQCASAIGTLAQQMKGIQEQQHQQAYQNQCTMGAMLQTMRLMNEKTQVQQELRTLKREYTTAKRALQFAQGQTVPPKEIEFRKQEVRDLAGEIEELENDVKEADEKASAFQSVAFPALLPASSFMAQSQPQDDIPMGEEERGADTDLPPSHTPGTGHPQDPGNDFQAGSSHSIREMENEEAQVAGILSSFAAHATQVFSILIFFLSVFQIVVGYEKPLRQLFQFKFGLFKGWDPPNNQNQCRRHNFLFLHPEPIHARLKVDKYGFLSLLMLFMYFNLYYYSISFAILFIPAVRAATPFNFNTLSLNLNGCANPAKISAVADIIQRESPHVFTFQETKSSVPVSRSFNLPDYHMSDAPGVSTGPRHKGKWGLVMGIKKSSSSAAKIYVPDALHGRAIVADLLIPSSSGGAILHRFIGIYAPWDPGETEDISLPNFWAMVRNICQETRSSFTLMGEFNTVYSSIETSSTSAYSPSLQNQAHYLSFLQQAEAVDAWSNRPERSCTDMWTFRSYAASPTHYAILDRMATSLSGVLATHIDILHDFIPGTDHRPIIGRAVLASPENARDPLIPPPTPSTQYSPRFYFPRRQERHRLKDFERTVNGLLETSWPHGAPKTFNTDDEFESFYQQFTAILKAAANLTFESPTSRSIPYQTKPISPTIRKILCSTHQMNRLISSLKRNQPFPNEPWVEPIMAELQAAKDRFPDLLPLTFFKAIRRILAKCRYQEERKVIQDQANRRHGAQVNSLLRGGSAKTFYPSSFSPLPVVLSTNKLEPFTDLITGRENILSQTVSYFTGLYTRGNRPQQPKPWLTSASVQALAAKVVESPFQWPQLLSLQDTRLLLKKGNR
ncbi:hypothetical protein C0992_000432 [Termitomyces sp. T32_za158]|nr:hypothetical protein C0992_000432 [Termitomyces sp. T32_za158]